MDRRARLAAQRSGRSAELCGAERCCAERCYAMPRSALRLTPVTLFIHKRHAFCSNNNNVRRVLSERVERVAVKGRGRRPLFIFIIIYNLDVGVRAASVIIIFSSVSTVIASV